MRTSQSKGCCRKLRCSMKRKSTMLFIILNGDLSTAERWMEERFEPPFKEYRLHSQLSCWNKPSRSPASSAQHFFSLPCFPVGPTCGFKADSNQNCPPLRGEALESWHLGEFWLGLAAGRRLVLPKTSAELESPVSMSAYMPGWQTTKTVL